MNVNINPKTVLPHLKYLLHTDKPITVLFGSAGSGKSYQMMSNAILWALEGRTVLIARKQQNQIRKSVYPEVRKAMTRMKLGKYFDVNLTDMTIVNKYNDGAILFVGVDDENKLKSITAPKGSAIDTVIMEEADAFTGDDQDQLVLRRRGLTPFPKRLFIIFNPVSIGKMKWCWDRYFSPAKWDDEEDMFYEDDEVTLHRCNFDKNSYLDEGDLLTFRRMKKENPAKYRIYGEGRFGSAGKTVFDPNKFRLGKLDVPELLKSREYELRIGADFGYTHANALTIALQDRHNKVIYVIGLVKKHEITKNVFAGYILEEFDRLGIDYKHPVFCDTAEPASIDTLVDEGILGAGKAKKGDGSVANQVDFLQGYTIIIDEEIGKPLLEEMESLSYKKKADDTYSEELDDRYGDDLVASFRYAFSWEAWYAQHSSIEVYTEAF